MYLSQTEEDRLAIFTAAQLARRSLADGARLNAPEATAIICDEMHRAARLGASADAVLAAGRAAVSREDLMDGIAALLPEIRLEVLTGDGTRLVVLRDPWEPASRRDRRDRRDRRGRHGRRDRLRASAARRRDARRGPQPGRRDRARGGPGQAAAHRH